MSALTSTVRSSQLRHALRTPLNQIAGYTEMLIEDASCSAPGTVPELLEQIRANGRLILDFLQQELPPDKHESTPGDLDGLRARMRGPLQMITSSVGRLVSDGLAAQSGLNLADILRIGTAAAELVEFAHNERDLWSAVEPVHDARKQTGSMATGDVLVVDDNPGNRDLLHRMLERNGYRAYHAASGEAALAELGGRSFDLILLDLMMPGMDGIAVLERLKSESRWRNIPVVMLSALDESSRVIQCLEIGAEDYVVKPFDPVLLLARLRSTLERSRLGAAEALRARELEAAYEKLRENEQRLQESEERFRLATDAAEVGIWYYYPAQDRVLLTHGCKRLFGLKPDDEPLVYAQMQAQIHPEDRNRAHEDLRRALDNESEYDIEYRVVWPGNLVRWLSLRGMAKCVGSHRELRLAGVALDITSRRQAEDAVRQAQKLESIGLLAGGIAHDFNNLLTGIIGSASFVMDNLAEDDPNAQMLRNVVTAGERAADLTKQLLAYSGKGKFAVQRLDLSKLVSDIAALLRSSISRVVTLDRHLAEGLPRIEGDATQIQQIVMNLVINGSEAIEGEGAVRLETGIITLQNSGRENFVFGDDLAPGDYVYLEVRDTGSGMDREMVGKIFEPFFTTKFTGRGLGLAAVFGIVRGHNGGLEVITAPGSGTTFRVYFPPATGETVRRKTEQEKTSSAILFVDDEAVVRFMSRTALERAGMRVTVAETGEEALRLLKQNPRDFALAVLDLTMPGWSGFETLHRMREISPELPIILSTGYNEEEVRARYPNERPGALLTKPYSASALVARVKELLR